VDIFVAPNCCKHGFHTKCRNNHYEEWARTTRYTPLQLRKDFVSLNYPLCDADLRPRAVIVKPNPQTEQQKAYAEA
jgi:hypothetical protein